MAFALHGRVPVHRPSTAVRPCQSGLSRPRVRPAVTCRAAVQVETINELTDKLLTLEAELAHMFDSGRPMPKAAVVNAHREEIAALKAQLAQLVEGKLPPPKPPAPPPAPVSGGKKSKAAEPAPQPAPEPEVEALEKARLLLDGVTQQHDWGDDSANEKAIHLALLEAENERLRKQAEALLKRQQELEDMMAKVKAKSQPASTKTPVIARPASPAPASSPAAPEVQTVTVPA